MESLSHDPSDRRPAARFSREPLDPAAALAGVAAVTAGANLLFVGTARATTDGLVTTRLEYEAHEPLAARVLDGLRDRAIDRFGLVACLIEHRLGLVEPGQASVVVAVSSPHRREAFAAGEWLMDRIKREPPIWKREHRADGGGEWVHGSERPVTVAVEAES
jgi:molybdopterin synthase catalytic subunit